MSPQVQTTNITVRSMNGTYQTNTVQGIRASCTAGDKQAAQRLGEKLYGASLVHVSQVPVRGDYTLTHWKLYAEPVHAWAWQSGLIEFGREVPEGAIGFATGMDVPLRQLVDVLARHGQGKSEGKLLVPGVPEAETGKAQVDALVAWVDWCAKGNGKKESAGVVFTTRVEGKSS
ncbi:hypothetical protein [Rhodoferax sp.]|uniref:hypothetical protein n=1 Tax=Rhodoferax sp. TaxID=50421 RepID=UPI0025F9611C|nr:hypothetical protein [Rhodoferax sp.]MCM2340433.1 hypothetical protein [Rhodoferax sp.]